MEEGSQEAGSLGPTDSKGLEQWRGRRRRGGEEEQSYRECTAAQGGEATARNLGYLGLTFSLPFLLFYCSLSPIYLNWG